MVSDASAGLPVGAEFAVGDEEDAGFGSKIFSSKGAGVFD